MTEPDNLDLQPAHWQIVQSILRQHAPQCTVWAFGSRTSGSARRYSDLDRVVVADRPLSLDASAILKEAFLESDLPWQVDVLDWAELEPAFRDAVQRNKVVIQ